MPRILDSAIKQIRKKGYSKERAYAIASSSLQKAGVLREGSDELTAKGKKRQSMGAAKRRADRKSNAKSKR